MHELARATALRLLDKGQTAEAIAIYEPLLERLLLGKAPSVEVIDTQQMLLTAIDSGNDPRASWQVRDKLVPRLEARFGKHHWRCIDLRLERDHFARLTWLTPVEREELRKAQDNVGRYFAPSQPDAPTEPPTKTIARLVGTSDLAWLDALEDEYVASPSPPAPPAGSSLEADRAARSAAFQNEMRLLSTLHEDTQRICGRNHPRSLSVQFRIAVLELNRDHHAAAETSLRKILAALQATDPQFEFYNSSLDRDRLLANFRHLATRHASCGRHAQSIDIYQNLYDFARVGFGEESLPAREVRLRLSRARREASLTPADIARRTRMIQRMLAAAARAGESRPADVVEFLRPDRDEHSPDADYRLLDGTEYIFPNEFGPVGAFQSANTDPLTFGVLNAIRSPVAAPAPSAEVDSASPDLEAAAAKFIVPAPAPFVPAPPTRDARAVASAVAEFRAALQDYSRLMGNDPRRQARAFSVEAAWWDEAGDTRQALAAWHAAQREIEKLSPDHPGAAALADRCEACLDEEWRYFFAVGNLPAAKTACELLMAERRGRREPQQWSILNAQHAQEYVDNYGQLTPADQRLAQETDQVFLAANEAFPSGYSNDPPDGRYREALRQVEAAIAVRTALFGPTDRQALGLRAIQVKIDLAQGNFDLAETAASELLARVEAKCGVLHPAYGIVLSMLAEAAELRGDYAASDSWTAADRAIGALVGFRPTYAVAAPTGALKFVAFGEEDDALARMGAQFRTLMEAGDYPQAEPLAQFMLSVAKQGHGEQHPSYALASVCLADVASDTGDHLEAQRQYERALAILEQAVGTNDRGYATALHNLALLHLRAERDAEALACLQREQQTLAALGDEQTVSFAHSLSTEGSILSRLDREAEAAVRFAQALMMLEAKQAQGERIYPVTLNEQGFNLVSQGQFAEATVVLQRALDTLLNPNDRGEAHHNLAVLYDVQGQFAEANVQHGEALKIAAASLEVACAIQTPRQQIASAADLRERLDSYLSLAVRGDLPNAEVYQHALAWRGIVHARRSEILARVDDQQVQELINEIDVVTGDLASTALGTYEMTPDEFQAEIARLAESKSSLERKLAHRWGELRGENPAAGISIGELQAALPAGVCLLDFVEYRHIAWKPVGPGLRGAEWRLLAFVIHREGPVQRVELGPSASIQEHVKQWANGYADRRRQEDDPGLKLRTLVWEKVSQYLQAGEIILIAPDGPLSSFPFAALPGSKPGQYLLEEHALAIAPQPASLVQISRQPLLPVTEPSMLIVGGVDYNYGDHVGHAVADPADDAIFRYTPQLHGWKPLPGAHDEVYVVRGRFMDAFVDSPCRYFAGPKASEFALRNAVSRYRWLHLATHGFFAKDLGSTLPMVPQPGWQPPDNELPSLGPVSLSAMHPGLLSGIALAGANRPSDPQGDDGLLTAFEVAEMNLQGVDMAVLSACETGLGEYQRGEGLLSLQRAFHLAGTKTVVSTLWPVDDKFTRSLMGNFYDNLWNKKMGKLEALRQAQITHMKEGARALIPINEQLPDSNRRLPPYYWAPFVLSGDWQ